MEGSEDYSEPIYNFMIVISHVPPKNVGGNFQQSPSKACWKIIPNRFTNYATRLYRRRVHTTVHNTGMIGFKGCKHFLHPFSFTPLTLWKGESIQWTPFRLLYAFSFIFQVSIKTYHIRAIPEITSPF